jgi:hypothetical protein
MMKKIRLSLDVTPEMKAIIEGLAARAGTNQGEMLRRAVALFNAAQNAKERGEELAVISGEEIKYKLVGY